MYIHTFIPIHNNYLVTDMMMYPIHIQTCTHLSHAGKVQSTESTYKHKMQVQEGKSVDTSSSTIESSPPDQLLADPNETSTPDKTEGPTNETPPTPPIEEQQPGDEVADQQTATTN